jgi:hypothetical protein
MLKHRYRDPKSIGKKKIKWHTRCGDIVIVEQAYYDKGKKTIRPFQLSSGIRSRSCSYLLQRALVDFGADESFYKAEQKLKEHYGIKICISTIRAKTISHAIRIKSEEMKKIKAMTPSKIGKPVIISETDGSMVPIVVRDKNSKDKRKNKQLIYREARLSLAYEPNSTCSVFSGEIGSTDTAGSHIKYCVNLLGYGKNTKVHAVGDGALWIAEQVELQFGAQAKYLVDFYHVSEYISAASPDPSDSQVTKAWLSGQQELLKNGKFSEVLSNLSIRVATNKEAEKCYNYLHNRKHQLHYKEALDNELPIGSGDIESAHRYIIQERLKIPGAYWDENNANSMIALRTFRANKNWEKYWDVAL